MNLQNSNAKKRVVLKTRSDKKPSVTLICAACGIQFQVRPYRIAEGPPKCCSVKCAGIFSRKPHIRAEINCGHCGKVFSKRRDHLKANNYCSRGCYEIGRRKGYAKWRDPEHIRQYMREYNRKNKKRLNQQHNDRRKRNPRNRLMDAQRRRAAKMSVLADFTLEQWEAMKLRYGSVCLCCRRKLPLEMDHVVAIVNGGTHTESNIQPLCRSCNATKGSRTIDYRQKWMEVEYGILVMEL